MGSSVIVGIAVTKFIGVIVLGFASSTLFSLYYFRMFMCIIVLGFFHGLAFLPVILSLIGPKVCVFLVLNRRFILNFFRLHIERSAMIIARDGRKRCNFESNSKCTINFNFI